MDAYDPATDTWRRIAEAPHGLNLASGMWTGQEVLVFGSLLNGKNRADTPTSVGAAYDPATDTWRELPPSALSPQATSAVWVDDRMVAWDYEVHSQEYDPARNAWSHPVKMPLSFSECYPESVVVRDLVFAFFCGRAALYDAISGTWQEIHGGPLEERVWSDAYQSYVEVWRFADLVPARDVVLLAAEGITLNRKGIACYGCPGSPVSLWAYRPPGGITAAAESQPITRRAARRVAEDFMFARVIHADGRVEWLVTPRAESMFGSPEHAGPEPLYAATSFRIDDVIPLDGRPDVFRVLVRLYLRGGLGRALGRVLRESLIVGPGRSLGRGTGAPGRDRCPGTLALDAG